MLGSLKIQIYLLVFIPFIFIAGLGLYSEITSTHAVENKVSEMTRDNSLELEKKRLVTIIDSAKSIISEQIAMPGNTGLDEALALINKIKYDGGKGYLFTYDLKGVRLQSGSGKGIGKNYWNNQDKKGNYITQNIIAAGKSGSGFTTYYFVKKGETVPSPKYSYSIYIPKWEVVISTGFFIDDVDRAQQAIDAAVLEVVDEAITQAIILILIAFILVGVIASIAINRLYRPLHRLRDSVRLLADGEGDLTANLPASSIDLLDEIATDFNTFLSSMSGDIRSLKETSSQLSSIAHSSSEHQAHLEELASQQKSERALVATAIDEMSATSSEIANTASETRESASSVETQMQVVLEQVQVSNDQLDNLSELMTGVSGSINELGDNVELIHSVLSVIQSISEQTNLLALNAAIEAARAGEQGRGFAVVADEVRNLAKRSQDSTVEIKEILDKLQASAVKTVEDMTRSDEQRVVVADAMSRIREIISGSNEAIQTLSELNVKVADVAHQQSTVSSEITERINSIAELADDIGNGSTTARKQFESLEVESEQISNITNKFTV